MPAPLNSPACSPLLLSVNQWVRCHTRLPVHPSTDKVFQFLEKKLEHSHLTTLSSHCPIYQSTTEGSCSPVCVCLCVCMCGRKQMEVFYGKMSSSDYSLRQFSNYSVKHQSCGLMQAVLWADGQCNHCLSSSPTPTPPPILPLSTPIPSLSLHSQHSHFPFFIALFNTTLS